MANIYIPETEENDRIQRGIVIGKVEILTADVKLPLPKVRSISQEALRRYFGNVELNEAIYSPGGEAVELPTPKKIFRALCGQCSDNPRHGHSSYCVKCIQGKMRDEFVDFYGRDRLAFHYLMIAVVGLLLIFGIVKYMPRTQKPEPVSTPIQRIQKTSVEV